ncbi:MAG: GAF domain-containing protein [Deltaproteobacteria bacterium]|jgi:signal transduction histidine kinase|nr:GAF domain-containing protein [Deltaproteobacteria bacterium]
MPNAVRVGDVAAFLAKLIRLANSNIQFEAKVGNFLSLLSWELSLDKSLLFFLDREKRLLLVRRPADEPTVPAEPLPLTSSFLERAIANRQPLLAEVHDLASLPELWRTYLAPFTPCLAVVPVVDDKTCYGAIMILCSRPTDLSSGPAGQVVEAVANQLALAIKNNQLATDTRKRISVLNVLSELGRSLSSTIEVDKVMSMIPRIAAGVFIADGCALNVLDRPGELLLYSSQYGVVPPAYNFSRFQGRALPRSAAECLRREAPFMGLMEDDPQSRDLTAKEIGNTVISMPLLFQGPHQGSITLFNKLGGHRGGGLSVSPQLFAREDMELLAAMNSMISGVVENALTFNKVEGLASTNEAMVRYLSNLYDISGAMLTTVRYDELVWIIVKALTVKQGLGFDKVLILLAKGDGDDLRLESSAYWSADSSAPPDDNVGLAEHLRRPLREEAALMMEQGREMSLKIAVRPDSTRILARATLEKKPLLGFRGLDASDDADLGDFGLRAYAAVPMLAKGREVGVIAVDRSLSGEPLTADSLRDLNMLANQAGLAIENTQLYEDLRQANQNLAQTRIQLIEAEKLAAQGEMGTQLAHEIRNPLVSIGGFTQRLLKKMPADDPLRKYPLVILEEVERLNGVLNNVLDFARDERGLVRSFQLEDVAKETVRTLRHEMDRTRVTINLTHEDNLPKVSADERQVMHVFLNLIYNASQAMAPQGGGLIRIRLKRCRENETDYVACQVTDTGPGVPDELLTDVFTPFFTTKTQGTGLGLSIVKKIIDRYNGLLTVANHPPEWPDGGASFTFMLPAFAEG